MVAGKAMVERSCPARASQSVLALNFANPFPSLLNRPSPRSSPIWLHSGRSFSAVVHIPADRLFGDVGCVMVAKNESNAADLQSIYRDTLARQFRPVDANQDWVLYARVRTD